MSCLFHVMLKYLRVPWTAHEAIVEVIEDSLDTADTTDISYKEDRKTIFRGKQKSWHEEDFTEKKGDSSDVYAPSISNGCIGKKFLDLNRHPNENEALDEEVRTMLKIYLDRVFLEKKLKLRHHQ